MRRSVTTLCCAALMVSAVGAVQLNLDRRAIEEAIYVGQSRIELQRARFHGPYRLSVARPPIDWIDVITPFHRVELAAETKARAGGAQFSQREALEVLAAAPAQIDLLVEMTFHPQNTFVFMPLYQVVVVGPGGERQPPRRLDRFPRFGPRGESTGPALPTPTGSAVLGRRDPILGGTMVAAFDGSRLENGREVLVLDGETELARVTLDLAKMR